MPEALTFGTFTWRTDRLLLVAGPCVIESADLTLDIARRLAEIARALDVDLVFKASYDKANRSSRDSFRGPGLEEGLRVLARVREDTGLPVLSDVHTPDEARAAGRVLDALQIPALLCRQTDLIRAAAEAGKPVNIKKGQFMAPDDMGRVLTKAAGTGAPLLVTERGTTFGYHNLVVDMRALSQLRVFGAPVLFDATHSVQRPGGGDQSGGERELVPVLARAAAGAGIDGLFVETHPDPDRAKSDSACMWPLDRMASLLTSVLAVHRAARAAA